jgi:hypothetical protein
MSGSQSGVVQMPSQDFNIQWDTTWNCAQTLLTWDNKSVDKYYILFEGSGNGSCSSTYNVDGVTYYYPYLYADEPSRAIISGQICGTLPLNNYTIIIRYYQFKKGVWNEYNSTPVNIPLGTNLCN